MDKKFLHKKLLDIYADEFELADNQIPTEASVQWQKLLDRATDLLEKCIKEGVRDD